jgi:UDP-GlcNAc:undecaprenyl-phosphate GlcNAc-1-phosphate transferase
VFKYILILFSSVALSLIATPVVRRIAIGCGAIDVPGGRRIHSVPTPRFGGLAVLLAIIFGLAVAGLADSSVAATLLAHSAEVAGLFAATTVLTVVGLVDDRRSLGPTLKLAVEILAGIIAVAAGCRIDMVVRIDLGWFGPTATVFWIVAVINAVNMIDGLDGLAAGAGLIISATLFSISLYLGNIESSFILAALSGALLGFLCYNFHPARIFLGDSGSLFIGFLLAVSAIQSSSKAATVTAIMWPLLALGLPVAELVLTTLRRTLRVVRVVRLDTRAQRYEFSFFGSAALFTADRDHIHHRLLATGLTHSRVVAILYGVCALFGVGSFLLVINYRDANVLLLILAFGLAAIAVKQLDYRELQPFRSGLLLPLFDLPASKRRLVCVLFDLAFISLSYLAASAILLNTFSHASLAPSIATIPLLAAVKIGCFMLAGLYRRSYRYAGIPDLFALGKAIALSTTGAWIVLFAAGYGRCPALSIVVLDAYLLATLLLGSRVSFRLLDYLFNLNRPGMRRALIYGAGSGGVAALHEIRSNPATGMRPVGFIDDDPRKQGRMLQGVLVYQSAELAALIEQRKTDAVVIATRKLPREELGKVARLCTDAGIMLRCFQITLDGLESFPQISRNLSPPLSQLSEGRLDDR